MAKHNSRGVNARGRNARGASFAGIPRSVMEHPDYQSLSGSAVKLLLEFAYQFRGHNNGDLTTAYSVLRYRGWRSKDTIRKATEELEAAGLIVKTREGRFCNPGSICSLYAITWSSIDECPGKNLDLGPTSTPYRKFSLEDIKTPGPETGLGSDQKLVRKRERDEHGRYVSDQKLVRLVAPT